MLGTLYEISGLSKLAQKISNKRMNKRYEIDDNTWVQISKEYKLEERLRKFGHNLAIQGEIIGPGIQKNRYKRTMKVLFIFGIFDIDKQQYLLGDQERVVIEQLNTIIPLTPRIDAVPKIVDIDLENIDVEIILKAAERNSLLNPDGWAEGLVFKWAASNGPFGKLSFKAINNQYLLKVED